MITCIIENFFDDLDGMVELSEEMTYHSTPQGLISDCIKDIDYDLFVEIIAKTIKSFHGQNSVADVSIEDASVRFVKADHFFDSGNVHRNDGLTAAIYLSDGDIGNVSIFDKKPNYFDTSRKERLDALKGDNKELYKKLVDSHMSNFKKTAMIQSKINRAIILDHEAWHSTNIFSNENKTVLMLLVSINFYELVD